MTVLPTPLNRWHRSRFAVGGGFFVFGFAAAIWLTHIPVVVRRLALEPATLGSILFASSLIALFANGFWGAVSTRLGSRRVVWMTLPCFLATVPLSIAATSAWLLTLVALFGGIAATGLNIALSTQASAFEAGSGRAVMSWFHSLFSIGGIAGALAGAGILRLGFGDGSGAALVLFGLLAGFAFLASALLPDPPATASKTSILAAMRHPAIVLLCVIVFCADFTEASVNDWGALFLSRMEGMNEAKAALGFALYSASIAAARLFGGVFVARFGPRRVLTGGGMLITTGTLLVILTSEPIISMAGFVLIALGGANLVPVLMSRGAQSGLVAPSVAIAALSTAQGIGFLVSPPLIGSVTQGFGLSTGLSVLFVVGAIAALTSLIAFRYDSKP